MLEANRLKFGTIAAIVSGIAFIISLFLIDTRQTFLHKLQNPALLSFSIIGILAGVVAYIILDKSKERAFVFPIMAVLVILFIIWTTVLGCYVRY
jgi:hypothetical protein